MFLDKFQYTKTEWVVAKILTILVWLGFSIRILFRFHSQPFPEGVCELIDCSIFARSPLMYFTLSLIFCLAVLYVLEKQMPVVTFLISVFSVILFSLEIANGGHSSRMEVLSMVFIVQFIAYVQCSMLKGQDASPNRVFSLAMMYSVQIVATAYVITGLSKLQESGIGWVMESQNFAVRVMRSYSSRAIDFSNPELAIRGKFIANFILHHILLVRFLFMAALFVELFAFLAIFSKRNARVYAIIILLFHTGLFFMLGGVLLSFALLVFIYMLNLPGLFLNEHADNLVSTGRTAESKTSVNETKVWYPGPKTNAVGFLIIPVLYLILSFSIGEVHPFSKFPMFASATDSTEYYYLADSDFRPIRGGKKFSLSCVEIKNMLYADAERKHIRVEDTERMKEVAKGLMDFIYTSNKVREIDPDAGHLVLVRHTIALVHGNLVESEVVMAERVK